jgi:stringent starvation protein B
VLPCVLLIWILENTYTPSSLPFIVVAVVFPDEFGKPDNLTLELPKHIRYKIRMDIDNVRPTNRLKYL